jgi:hypothetical protein
MFDPIEGVGSDQFPVIPQMLLFPTSSLGPKAVRQFEDRCRL